MRASVLTRGAPANGAEWTADAMSCVPTTRRVPLQESHGCTRQRTRRYVGIVRTHGQFERDAGSPSRSTMHWAPARRVRRSVTGRLLRQELPAHSDGSDDVKDGKAWWARHAQCWTSQVVSSGSKAGQARSVGQRRRLRVSTLRVTHSPRVPEAINTVGDAGLLAAAERAAGALVGANVVAVRGGLQHEAVHHCLALRRLRHGLQLPDSHVAAQRARVATTRPVVRRREHGEQGKWQWSGCVTSCSTRCSTKCTSLSSWRRRVGRWQDGVAASLSRQGECDVRPVPRSRAHASDAQRATPHGCAFVPPLSTAQQTTHTSTARHRRTSCHRLKGCP